MSNSPLCQKLSKVHFIPVALCHRMLGQREWCVCSTSKLALISPHQCNTTSAHHTQRLCTFVVSLVRYTCINNLVIWYFNIYDNMVR